MDRIRGVADLPLLPKGLQQVHELKTKLPKIDVAFAPHLQRNQQTAHILSPKVNTLPDLADMHYGGFEGKPTSEVIHKINDYIKNKPSTPLPGVGVKSGEPGESFDTFRQRFLPALKSVEDYADANPDKNVAAVLNRRAIKMREGWVAKGKPKDYSVDPSVVTEKAGPDPATGVKTGKHGNLYLVRHGQTAWNADPSVEKLKEIRGKNSPD